MIPRPLRVAHQRQDGMVVRGSRKLDRSSLGRLGMRRNHAREKFTFSSDDKCLIFKGIIPTLADHLRDVFLFEKIFVEPANL